MNCVGRSSGNIGRTERKESVIFQTYYCGNILSCSSRSTEFAISNANSLVFIARYIRNCMGRLVGMDLR